MDTIWHGLDIKTWIAITETGLKVAVAVAAGIWASFLLFYLQQRARADADIRKSHAESEAILVNIKKLETEIRRAEVDTKKLLADIDIKSKESVIALEKHELDKKESERKTRKQVYISIDIQINLITYDGSYVLIARIALTNNGNELTRIVWSKEVPAFTVRSVTFDDDGKAQHSEAVGFPVMLTRKPTEPAPSHVIRPGATETLTFAFQPRQPGLFLLTFRGDVEQDLRKEVEKHGVTKPTAWTASRYVFVGDASLAMLGTDAPRTLGGV
jgi:hypothetical protein